MSRSKSRSLHSLLFFSWHCVLIHSVVSDSSWPQDCGPPGFTVCGIPQARILQWAPMPSSRGSFQSRDQTRVSPALLAGSLPLSPPVKICDVWLWTKNLLQTQKAGNENNGQQTRQSVEPDPKVTQVEAVSQELWNDYDLYIHESNGKGWTHGWKTETLVLVMENIKQNENAWQNKTWYHKWRIILLDSWAENSKEMRRLLKWTMQGKRKKKTQ